MHTHYIVLYTHRVVQRSLPHRSPMFCPSWVAHGSVPHGSVPHGCSPGRCAFLVIVACRQPLKTACSRMRWPSPAETSGSLRDHWPVRRDHKYRHMGNPPSLPAGLSQYEPDGQHQTRARYDSTGSGPCLLQTVASSAELLSAGITMDIEVSA